MEERYAVLTEDWADRPAQEYLLIDVREPSAYERGHVDGAVHIPLEQVLAHPEQLPQGRDLVLYDRNGVRTEEAALELRRRGYPVWYLKDGYYGWRKKQNGGEVEKAAQVEKSIRKKFHREIWSQFAKAIRDYQLIQPGDKIAVCISGGKDSMLLAKLFQELKRHNKFPFEVVYLVMDPGYSKANREMIEYNARVLNVPIDVFETDIFASVFHVEKSPCYLCARMRRGYLYKEAQKRGCNKIALGHHYNDVIETTLMGMLFGGQVQTMMPKLHSTNHPGMELIRPMFLIKEKDVIHWRDYNGLQFLQCACKFTEQNQQVIQGTGGSKRKETKELIRTLMESSNQVESNIFHSVENVNLSTVLAYKDRSGTHSFLDTYDDYVPGEAEEDFE